MKHLVCAVFLVLSFYSTESLAALKEIAEVVKIRGSVTKLLPGSIEASKLELGEKLPEDTSIVTGAKSFVKIRLVDKSELNVGPESKIVISEVDAASVGIVSLLKGRIRTQVEKSMNSKDNSANKFFIRTRTAALGVRGTDFQTIYNPDNKLTSLLTYTGSVAMAKIDKDTHQSFEQGTKEVVRNDQTKALEIKEIPGKQINEREELKRVLSSKDSVIVPPGQNSFSSEELTKTSLPVKISPVQLNALYKNSEFDEKSTANLRSGLAATNVKMDVQQADQKAPVEGFYNAKTGDFAPRAGGFIDQNTGLYIAPENAAVLDSKTGTYRSERMGDVDADTGQYVAPQGLTLDAKKGFVVTEEKEARPELLALRSDLNNAIARDVVVGKSEDVQAFNLNERFIRDRLSLSLSLGKESLDLNENKNMPYSHQKSDGVLKLGADWQFASTGRFAPLIGIGYSSVDYENVTSSGSKQDSKGLFKMSAGLKYALSKRVDLYTKFMLDQAHFAEQTSGPFPVAYLYRRLVVSRVALGGDALVFNKGRFSLKTEASGAMSFRKRFNNFIVKPGLKLQAKIMPQWALDNKKAISAGLVFESEKHDLNNNFGMTYQKRHFTGLELSYTIDL